MTGNLTKNQELFSEERVAPYSSSASSLEPSLQDQSEQRQQEQEVSRVQQVFDTCEISAIYMQRPRRLIHTSLGHWFCLAHKLQDKELDYSTTALNAKRLIVQKGYNRLSLQPLEDYNKGDY